MSNFKFEGIDDVQKNIKKAKSAALDGIKRAVNEAAGDILNESGKQVPHDIGTLAGTGNVTPAKIDDKGNFIEAEVGYNTPYALRLHEHPEYKFKKGRKGKYLEDPVKARERLYKGDIEAEIRKVL